MVILGAEMATQRHLVTYPPLSGELPAYQGGLVTRLQALACVVGHGCLRNTVPAL